MTQPLKPSSGNVYQDLETKDAQAMQAKAYLVTIIGDVIYDMRLKQIQAAQKMGISQGDLSKLLNGQFRGFSLDRLFTMLLRLKQDITIHIQKTKHTPHIHLSFSHPS